MSSNFQERINAQGRAYIDGLRATVRACWASACQHDGIELPASFVVFSNDNPFVKFHDAAQRELWAAEREYRAGGYVGLRLTAKGAR